MCDVFNFCKDITPSTAQIFAEGLKQGNNVHLLIYGLYTARITEEALENSTLHEELSRYLAHPRFGAMAGKILTRLAGIYRGKRDPFNLLMEEEFGFEKEKVAAEKSDATVFTAQEFYRQKEEKSFVAPPSSAEQNQWTQKHGDNTYVKKEKSSPKKISSTPSSLPNEEKPASGTTYIWEGEPYKNPGRVFTVALPDMSKSGLPRETVDFQNESTKKTQTPRKHQQRKEYKRERWSPYKSSYRSEYRSYHRRERI